MNVPTALGHMLMPSAQRWADNQCRRVSPHVLPERHQLGPISGDCLDLPVRGVGICGVKSCILPDLFCLHGNIRPGNIAISLFFGALKLFFDFFVFLVKISRLVASYKLNCQN